ncbi:unnamed protein product [Amoebophrya sp. A25]|nr:unnamed protein product [Amoebophrya sp. A25]|eukprot:GSA25T00026528001.1
MSAAPDILKLDVVKPTSHNPTHSHTLLRVDGAGPSSLSYSLCRVEGSGPLRGAQREEECDKLGSQILRWIGTKPTPRPTGIYTAHEKSALLQQEYADFLVRCAEHDADLNFLKKTNRSEAVKLYSTPLGCWYLRHRQPSREDHQDILRSRGLHSGHSVGVWYPPQPHHGKVVGKRFSDDIERRYKPKRVAAPKLEIGKHTPNVIAFSPPRKPPAQVPSKSVDARD